MTLELRNYQRAAIDAIYDYFRRSSGNPIVCIPTAGGKSLVAAAFIQEVLSRWPEERILILTHVRELISQNFAELIRLWPEAPAGIYSAGLNRRDTQAQILFAGIQSVHRKAYAIQRADLVLIDEVHLVPRNATATYRRFLDDLTYHRHEKPGKPSSLRVDYHCGLVRHREWVCLKHDGYPGRKAAQWWQRRTDSALPPTVDEALARTHELRQPAEIAVRPNGRFTEVVHARFP